LLHARYILFSSVGFGWVMRAVPVSLARDRA
jgi:hypothetical protein